MTSTPITSVNLVTGTSENVTIVDENGVALPDSSIAWSVVAGTLTFGTSGIAQNLIITQDSVHGGFNFAAMSAGVGTMRATHGPSGKTTDLPVTLTNSVTSISAVSVT